MVKVKFLYNYYFFFQVEQILPYSILS